MVDAASLKERLQERVKNLMQQRAEVQQRMQSQLNTIDAQLAAVRDLATRFDSMTLTEALGVLQNTGVQIEIK